MPYIPSALQRKTKLEKYYLCDLDLKYVSHGQINNCVFCPCGCVALSNYPSCLKQLERFVYQSGRLIAGTLQSIVPGHRCKLRMCARVFCPGQ